MKMMSQHLSINIVLIVCLITLVIFANVSPVKCDPDTTIDDSFCSDLKVDPYSDYASEIVYALDKLTSQTCSQPLKDMSISGEYITASAYVQASVTDINDCGRCLEAASSYLKREGCFPAVNAYVVMRDCEMRYFPNPPLA